MFYTFTMVIKHYAKLGFIPLEVYDSTAETSPASQEDSGDQRLLRNFYEKSHFFFDFDDFIYLNRLVHEQNSRPK